MSTDPFANTITVKNILQHVISPKIVKDGNGGYITKTDLVNVDTLVFSSVDRDPTGGTIEKPFTAQCGFATCVGPPGGGLKRYFVKHTRVTPNSVIIVSNTSEPIGRTIAKVEPGNGEFEILFSVQFSGETFRVAWFIAAF
jgi:hypothetical protein